MLKVIEMLSNYIFAAMVSWVPVSDHAYYEKQEETIARYHDIANTIAEVALDPTREPMFAGDDDEIKTALLLASIASSESFFRKSVDDCKVSGDNNLAWGLWQTHASKKLVCSNRKAAAIVALDMAKDSLNSCKSFPLLDRMSVYTDGSCHVNWNRSRQKMGRAIEYFKNNKLELKYETSEQYPAQH
jgi:hypothetical protein